MNATLCFRFVAIALAGLASAVFAAPSPQDQAYNAFLQKIAVECKPLVIGNDNFSQAIIFNGQGADPSNYGIFLDRTKALFNGGLSPKDFKNSIALGADGGKFSDKAIECIINHVPKK
jgi:hypothetical protein